MIDKTLGSRGHPADPRRGVPRGDAAVPGVHHRRSRGPDAVPDTGPAVGSRHAEVRDPGGLRSLARWAFWIAFLAGALWLGTTLRRETRDAVSNQVESRERALEVIRNGR